MVYDTQSLKIIYNGYSNLNQKISLDTKKNKLTRIKRGLYTTDIDIDAPIIANVCCSPSYISFEYALSFYGLIPERVILYTSACYGKKDNEKYTLDNKTFEYRSIPNSVFPYGINFLKNEMDVRYKIASKEKALCDTLYSKYPVRSIKDIKIMLFDDLRVDFDEFINLDFEFIKNIGKLYHSNTISTLIKYIGELENEK